MKYVVTVAVVLDTVQKGAYAEHALRQFVTRALYDAQNEIDARLPAGIITESFGAHLATPVTSQADGHSGN